MTYFNKQTNINNSSRKIIIKWMMEIIDTTRLHYEIFHLAVNIMDDYLNKTETIICAENFRCVAIICIVIASKMDTPYDKYVELDEAVRILKNLFSQQYLAIIERNIVEELNYQLYRDTITKQIDIVCKERNVDKDDHYFALFIATLLLSTLKYKNHNPKIYAEEIVNFSINLHTNLDYVKKMLNFDNFYNLFYTTWRKYVSKSADPIYVYFSKEEFNYIAFRPIIVMKYNKNYKLKCPYKIKNTVTVNILTENDFETIKFDTIIGNGTFGSVYRVQIDNQKFAVKKIEIKQTKLGIDAIILREINILAMLSHPNIIKMVGIFYDYMEITMYIYFELMDNDLYTVRNKFFLSEKTKHNYIIQLMIGVKYIHGNNIMHRDLSTKNILISNDGILKIADFGSARYFYHSQYSIEQSDEVCSYVFRAIEIFLKKQPYTYMVDIWSSACIIGYILTGNYLFNGTNEEEYLQNIICTLADSNIGFKNLYEKYPRYMKILFKMLKMHPMDRINADIALNLFSELK